VLVSWFGSAVTALRLRHHLFVVVAKERLGTTVCAQDYSWKSFRVVKLRLWNNFNNGYHNEQSISDADPTNRFLWDYGGHLLYGNGCRRLPDVRSVPLQGEWRVRNIVSDLVLNLSFWRRWGFVFLYFQFRCDVYLSTNVSVESTASLFRLPLTSLPKKITIWMVILISSLNVV